MTDPSTLPFVFLLPICFLGGLFIGWGYFRALRETANLIVGGGKPLRAIVLTHDLLAIRRGRAAAASVHDTQQS